MKISKNSKYMKMTWKKHEKILTEKMHEKSKPSRGRGFSQKIDISSNSIVRCILHLRHKFLIDIDFLYWILDLLFVSTNRRIEFFHFYVWLVLYCWNLLYLCESVSNPTLIMLITELIDYEYDNDSFLNDIVCLLTL